MLPSGPGGDQAGLLAHAQLCCLLRRHTSPSLRASCHGVDPDSDPSAVGRFPTADMLGKIPKMRNPYCPLAGAFRPVISAKFSRDKGIRSSGILSETTKVFRVGTTGDAAAPTHWPLCSCIALCSQSTYVILTFGAKRRTRQTANRSFLSGSQRLLPPYHQALNSCYVFDILVSRITSSLSSYRTKSYTHRLEQPGNLQGGGVYHSGAPMNTPSNFRRTMAPS
jgi:hypothetical protein